MSLKKQVLIGEKYSLLTVIKLERVIKYTKQNTEFYRCKCECGNEIVVDASRLRTGKKKHCGCKELKYLDLTGEKYGQLTVLGLNEKRGRSYYWDCVCSCGGTTVVGTHGLRRSDGPIKSCGCLAKDAVRKNQQIGLVDGTNVNAIKEGRKPNKNNSSGHLGVSWNTNRKKWYAGIEFKGKSIYLGSSVNLEEAIKFRKDGEEKYFGAYRKKES